MAAVEVLGERLDEGGRAALDRVDRQCRRTPVAEAEYDAPLARPRWLPAGRAHRSTVPTSPGQTEGPGRGSRARPAAAPSVVLPTRRASATTPTTASTTRPDTTAVGRSASQVSSIPIRTTVPIATRPVPSSRARSAGASAKVDGASTEGRGGWVGGVLTGRLNLPGVRQKSTLVETAWSRSHSRSPSVHDQSWKVVRDASSRDRNQGTPADSCRRLQGARMAVERAASALRGEGSPEQPARPAIRRHGWLRGPGSRTATGSSCRVASPRSPPGCSTGWTPRRSCTR